MQEILSTIGGALVGFITSLVEAFTTGFSTFFWTGEGSTRSISDAGIFMLVLFGVAMAVGLSKLIYGLVKNR